MCAVGAAVEVDHELQRDWVVDHESVVPQRRRGQAAGEFESGHGAGLRPRADRGNCWGCQRCNSMTPIGKPPATRARTSRRSSAVAARPRRVAAALRSCSRGIARRIDFAEHGKRRLFDRPVATQRRRDAVFPGHELFRTAAVQLGRSRQRFGGAGQQQSIERSRLADLE